MIRQATIQDFKAIRKLRQQSVLSKEKLNNLDYKVSVQKTGFLLPGKLTLDLYKEQIKPPFLVYTQGKKILGYIRSYFEDGSEEETNNELTWYSKEIKTAYLSKLQICIGAIAVDRKYTSQGIGTALVSELCKVAKNLKHTHLFSYVILSPITNLPSIVFHEKMGFMRSALCQIDEYEGLKNFESILYSLKL